MSIRGHSTHRNNYTHRLGLEVRDQIIMLAAQWRRTRLTLLTSRSNGCHPASSLFRFPLRVSQHSFNISLKIAVYCCRVINVPFLCRKTWVMWSIMRMDQTETHSGTKRAIDRKLLVVFVLFSRQHHGQSLVVMWERERGIEHHFSNHCIVKAFTVVSEWCSTHKTWHWINNVASCNCMRSHTIAVHEVPVCLCPLNGWLEHDVT